MDVPILPPEESHRAGIPVVMAIQARIAEAERERLKARNDGRDDGMWLRWDERLDTLRECLALEEATQTVPAPLEAHVRQEAPAVGRALSPEDRALAEAVFLIDNYADEDD